MISKVLGGCGFLDRGRVSGGRGDAVAECVVGVVAAFAEFVDVGFEDVFGSGGVVQEVGEAIDETGAFPGDEEFRRDAAVWVAESVADGVGAVEPVGFGHSEMDAFVGIFFGDRKFGPLGEDIRAGPDFEEDVGGGVVIFDHLADGGGVLFRQPAGAYVFVEDVDVTVAVFGEKEEGGGVPVAEVHGGPIVPVGWCCEGVDDVVLVS